MENTDPIDDRTYNPSRKITAVGTIGQVGQLFTIYEKNWKCKECGQENYAGKLRCNRCRHHKPEGKNEYVLDPALEALQRGEEILWKETIDPNTYQIYYYNTQTGETQWERPEILGPAPHATGWFGRGQSGTMAAQLYIQKNLLYLTRPARKQKDFIDPKNYHLEGANEYNIWYGRYLGDHWDSKGNKEKAADRCVLETDAGYTKADSIHKNLQSNGKDRRYFCIHFSHGVCAKGVECKYYHRIPTLEDDARCDELVDCFGRQRHNKHRDDMSGVGSFLKPCRTLFVGGILKQKYDSPQAVEEAVWKHFGEWGEVESVNFVQRLSVTFVRYRVRTSAEFAKEAMINQSLDQGEILDIKWAHDDPNPVAQDAIDRANRDALYALMQAKGISLTNTGYQYPAEYALPAAKKMKLDNGIDLLQQHPELAYPNTDQQYSSSSYVLPEGVSQEEYIKAWSDYAKSYGYTFPQTSNDTTTTTNAVDDNTTSVANDNDNEKEEEDKEEEDQSNQQSSHAPSKDWIEVLDDETGATYYYNPQTGESSWGVAPDEDDEEENNHENKEENNHEKEEEEVKEVVIEEVVEKKEEEVAKEEKKGKRGKKRGVS